MDRGQLLTQAKVQPGARAAMEEHHRSATSVSGLADSDSPPLNDDIQLRGHQSKATVGLRGSEPSRASERSAAPGRPAIGTRYLSNTCRPLAVGRVPHPSDPARWDNVASGRVSPHRQRPDLLAMQGPSWTGLRNPTSAVITVDCAALRAAPVPVPAPAVPEGPLPETACHRPVQSMAPRLTTSPRLGP
jgi:hypothetical protein